MAQEAFEDVVTQAIDLLYVVEFVRTELDNLARFQATMKM
jgi:hypothetical protein